MSPCFLCQTVEVVAMGAFFTVASFGGGGVFTRGYQ